jgi:serine/threonine protein kinase
MAEAPEPDTIGKYKILGFLGQGAMGKVYKAHDSVLGRDVAVKTISSIMAGDPDLRKRFHREAQAAARLNHPNIITVYEYSQEGEVLYIAMELLEGTDLKGFMDSGALKSLGAKINILAQICDGLSFAHSKGVIHRDLKPANVHVSTTGQVKIMDFGLARVDSGDRSKAGMVVGTPNYMSPEQVMGDDIDARTDIFSSGAVFYELLTNRKPFDADSVHGILFQVVHKEPTPLRQLVKELPPILAEVVEKALAKDRNLRFQTAAEFREALTYVEHALASGRPNEARLSRSGDPTLLRGGPPIPPPVSPSAGGSVAVDGTVALDMKPARRPASRSGPVTPGRPGSSGTRTNPRSLPPRKRRSSVGPVIGIAFVIALIAGAYVYREPLQQWYERAFGGATSMSVPSGEVDAKTFMLVKAQIDLARAKLDDKDYRAALDNAESAVRLMPSSAEARALRDQAKGLVQEVETAARDAQDAVSAGDTERASTALSRLLSLDPKHPVAVEVSSKLNAAFRKQADDAKRLAEEARREAEKAGASKQGAFESGAAAVREAGAQVERGGFADATRGYLEARDQFERARRSARPSNVERPPATSAAATAVAPAPTEVAASAPVEAAAVAVEPRRGFVLGETRVQSRRTGKGVAGFEDGDVSVQQPAELQGRIDIDFAPSSVRAGDPYTLQTSFTNLGRKPVKVKEASLTFRVNGETSLQSAMPETKEVAPNQTVRLAESAGTWSAGIRTWQVEVTITSDKGETCRRELRLQK